MIGRKVLSLKHLSVASNGDSSSSSSSRSRNGGDRKMKSCKHHHDGKKYPRQKASLHALLTPEVTFIPSLTAPDPLVATVVNSVGYLLLKASGQKSLTPAGLINSAILGLGLWTFLGEKCYIFHFLSSYRYHF